VRLLSLSRRLPLRLPLLRGSRLGAATRLQHGVTFGKQSSIYDDEHLFPDHVHEEEKTGIKAGLPMPRDAELWKSPNDPSLLLPERAELWWDDGTAEPEWFVDRGSAGGSNGGRPWALSNQGALAQLLGMFTFLGVVVGGSAYALGDGLCPAAKRWDHGFPDDGHLKAQFGHKSAEGEEEEEEE